MRPLVRGHSARLGRAGWSQAILTHTHTCAHMHTHVCTHTLSLNTTEGIKGPCLSTRQRPRNSDVHGTAFPASPQSPGQAPSPGRLQCDILDISASASHGDCSPGTLSGAAAVELHDVPEVWRGVLAVSPQLFWAFWARPRPLGPRHSPPGRPVPPAHGCTQLPSGRFGVRISNSCRGRASNCHPPFFGTTE